MLSSTDFPALLSCLARARLLVELGRAFSASLPSNVWNGMVVKAFWKPRWVFEVAWRLLVAIEDAAINSSFAAEGKYRDLPRPGEVVREHR